MFIGSFLSWLALWDFRYTLHYTPVFVHDAVPAPSKNPLVRLLLLPLEILSHILGAISACLGKVESCIIGVREAAMRFARGMVSLYFGSVAWTAVAIGLGLALSLDNRTSSSSSSDVPAVWQQFFVGVFQHLLLAAPLQHAATFRLEWNWQHGWSRRALSLWTGGNEDAGDDSGAFHNLSVPLLGADSGSVVTSGGAGGIGLAGHNVLERNSSGSSDSDDDAGYCSAEDEPADAGGSDRDRENQLGRGMEPDPTPLPILFFKTLLPFDFDGNGKKGEHAK